MACRLTKAQALHLFETVFETPADEDDMNFAEVTVLGTDIQRAQSDIESYLAKLDDEIEPRSIRVIPDHIDDDPTADCVTITIFTED